MGNEYKTRVQWGGRSAPWHDNGIWTIGGRDNQRAIFVDIESGDDGQNFQGEMAYGTGNPDFPGRAEGKIAFKASHRGDNQYDTQVQWGGSDAPWHDNGVWTIGGRENQRAVALQARSDDDGKTLVGSMRYGTGNPDFPGRAEGPIGFQAVNED